MSFLASTAQKSLLILQKNQVDYERQLIMNKANQITREMNYYANSFDDDNAPDLDNDPYYIELQQTEEFLESRQDSLNDQYTLLDNEINSLKTGIDNNIKSSCSLNLLGG